MSLFGISNMGPSLAPGLNSYPKLTLMDLMNAYTLAKKVLSQEAPSSIAIDIKDKLAARLIKEICSDVQQMNLDKQLYGESGKSSPAKAAQLKAAIKIVLADIIEV